MGKKHRALFYGDESANIFAASSGSDTVWGYGGDDVINDTDTNVADVYFGGTGDDLIFTDGGNDAIFGGNGRDKIVSNNYIDFDVDGGGGVDTLDFQVLIGHSLEWNVIDAEKTVIKVFDDASGLQTQKIVARDIEQFDWYMIG